MPILAEIWNVLIFWKKMSMSLRKKLTDQKKRWASYPAHLRTGQNAHICWKIKCFDILKKNVNEFTQKVGGPKKRWAPYPAQLRTGQNAQKYWKKRIEPFLSPLDFLLIDSAAKVEFLSSSDAASINFAGFFLKRTGRFWPLMLSLPETFRKIKINNQK